ncbi:MAG: hypothetical protein QOE00_747 [Ilumatobacteraceae bacterium]
MPLTALPNGMTSEDLDRCVSSVLTTSTIGETAHLLMGDGLAISARLLTIRSEDAAHRYLIAVLAPDVRSDEWGRLRHSDRLYELWFERAPAGVCLVATDGTFLRVNPAYCNLVGRTELELQRMTFQDITHPDDLLLDVSLVEDVLAERIDRYDIDKRYVRPDGSIVWVHLTVALLRDESGEPLHFISMLEDITERRQAQETLQTTLELWRTTFERSPVAMVVLALDGTIMQANDAAGELMGRAPDELVGLCTPDLGDADVSAESHRNLARLASGEISTNIAERRLRDRYGRERWLSVHTAAVVGVGGRVERLLMQVIDVTEARALREQLQQSVEGLSLAYREKTALMTALSHDLRTPLAAIRILAELLVTSDESAQGDRADFARRLLAEAARTEGVLGDLVASERASSGLITPRRVPIALNDLVRRVVDLEGDHAPSQVIVAPPGSGDCTVSADPALVERMAANLLSNALRHTPAGTTVWVSVDGDPPDGEGTVRLLVEDDGQGVPDALKEAIFEPYVRGAAVDRPGTGIGLFLVRRFAEFHGGSVVCGDRHGGGASFLVTLPRV